MCALKFPVCFLLVMCFLHNGFGLSILSRLEEMEEAKDYEGYAVLVIEPLTKAQHEFIANFLENYHGEVDIWKSLEIFDVNNHTSTVVLIPPELVNFIINQLKENNVDYKILIQNLKEVIQHERELQQSYNKTGYISFDHYYRHPEINAYLDHLAETYPEFVKIIDIGKSYEGRDLKMIHISKPSDVKKPKIFIDGGIHAREWIAPAQVVYIINQLVENATANMDLLENLDWYLIPVVNPDGYEFSHEKDRLWRRTRSKVAFSIIPKCIGVDANRNWDIYWGGYRTAATQSSHPQIYGHIPCVDDYAGPEAFSECEIKQIADFAETIKSDIKLYLTFHSHGSKILYPWGYTDTLPENVKELNEVGRLVNKELIEPYTVGSSANSLYFLTGSSKDYFRDKLGVDLSYTIELPAGGSSGFDLPPKKIHGVVRDMFNGVRRFAKYVEDKYFFKKIV